jgi:gluconate 5-dehydrogenase
VDVLVNNAGVAGPVPAVHETVEHWQRMFDVNTRGVFWFSREVGRRLIEAQRSGSIVNITSVAAQVGMLPIKEASYCASKGAVESLTRALAVEWASNRVRVNALSPGWFRTEMSNNGAVDPRLDAHLKSNCPMGRWGEAAELDGALLFFASEASSYCTGQVLAVDGGWVAR